LFVGFSGVVDDYDGALVEGEPKTARGRRTIELDPHHAHDSALTPGKPGPLFGSS
jgi:hypothetical protein